MNNKIYNIRHILITNQILEHFAHNFYRKRE
nr:MAG TPA: hypothetical protein [Bacteriophage sp.]